MLANKGIVSIKVQMQKYILSPKLSGKRGIRTPGTVARTLDFESSPIDHSGSFPYKDHTKLLKSLLLKRKTEN